MSASATKKGSIYHEYNQKDEYPPHEQGSRLRV